MHYKMIFCDMDNTLLNSNLEISQGNREAIQKAMKKGVKFVICTGRGIYGVEKYIVELGLKEYGGYVICQNGGTVYELSKGTLVQERPFDTQYMRIIAKAAHTYGVDIQMYYDRLLMAEKITPRIEKYRQTMGTAITIVPNAEEYKGKLTKCLLNGTREKLVQVKTDLEKHLQGKLNMYFTNKEYLEFTAIPAQKGLAMLALAESLGIQKEEVIAIGDSENDISMLKEAGLGIAVANAEPEAKQQAKEVTKADCDHDAVKEVIEKFIIA